MRWGSQKDTRERQEPGAVTLFQAFLFGGHPGKREAGLAVAWVPSLWGPHWAGMGRTHWFHIFLGRCGTKGGAGRRARGDPILEVPTGHPIRPGVSREVDRFSNRLGVYSDQGSGKGAGEVRNTSLTHTSTDTQTYRGQ